MRINWGQKLSSRKFWSLIMAQVVSVGILVGLSDNTLAQILAVVGNFGSIIMYIFSEAKVDVARAKGEGGL